MNFHEHQTLYESCKRSGLIPGCTAIEFYRDVLPRVSAPNGKRELARSERPWYEDMRPYYKVWPAIAEAMFRVRLDVEYDALNLRDGTILIRFAVGCEPTFSGYSLRTILARTETGKATPPTRGAAPPGSVPDLTTGELLTGLSVSVGFIADGKAVSALGLLCMRRGESIESSLQRAQNCKDSLGEFVGLRGFDVDEGPAFNDIRSSVLNRALQAAITTKILASDPEFIKPDVLAADREKFDATGDMKYVEKAKRRGVVGWRIGESFESIPHFRRPHLGLRHTGPGRTVPKIVPIKGAVVHRQKMTQVPTGYITPDGIEVEP